MNGTELIAYLSSNVPSILSSVGTIIGSIITVVFLRSNTSTTEFEKIKTGKFDEVVEDLLSAGQMTYTEFYRAKNFLKIAKKADKYYSKIQRENENRIYDFDWFMRYYDAAGNISDDDMQEMWAKVLAGEISNPSIFSLRAIDILKSMRKADAELFVKICKFSFSEPSGELFLPNYDDYLEKNGIEYSDVMKLNEMGLIFNDSLITLRFQITTEPGLVFVNSDLGMTLATKGEESLDVGIQQYPFTQAGKELATLVVNCPSDEDFIEFGKNIAKFNNYKVGIHKIIEIDGENFEYDDINILED